MRELPELDRLFNEAVETGVVGGLVAMAADANIQLYECALGRRVLPDGPAMTANSVFWLASMTKAITTAAAMQLVERGKLKLDSPIGDVLPELAPPDILEGFDTAGEPRLRPATAPITLRNLLTHTSGFGYDCWNGDLVRYEEKAGVPSLFTCLNAALGTPLLFEPGTRWHSTARSDRRPILHRRAALSE
jgi:methyl acetate hydrolase